MVKTRKPKHREVTNWPRSHSQEEVEAESELRQWLLCYSCGPTAPASSPGLLPSTPLSSINQLGLLPQGWSAPLLVKRLPWLPAALDND